MREANYWEGIVQDTARDSTSGGEAPKITSPSISDVLAAYLAEDIARFAAKTYGLHAVALGRGRRSRACPGGITSRGTFAKQTYSHTSNPPTSATIGECACWNSELINSLI